MNGQIIRVMSSDCVSYSCPCFPEYQNWQATAPRRLASRNDARGACAGLNGLGWRCPLTLSGRFVIQVDSPREHWTSRRLPGWGVSEKNSQRCHGNTEDVCPQTEELQRLG